MEIIISKHGAKRLRERNKMNKKSMQRMTEKAFYDGLKVEDLTGELRKWVIGADEQRIEGNLKPRVYGDRLFLFGGQEETIILITTMVLPCKMAQEAAKIKKKESVKSAD